MFPGWFAWILAKVIFVPGAYTMYSVKKYFGFLRAAGADHFDQNIEICPSKEEVFLNGLQMQCILLL